MKPFLISSRESTRLKKSILDALRPGKRNAIKGSELARLMGEGDDRRIRVAIRGLIAEGQPIASSVSEPMGFYITSNEFEAAEYIHVLNNRIKEDTGRLNDFRKAVSNYAVPEQYSMFK